MNQTLAQEIRTILNLEWNPIGLSLSQLDDEYDDYVKAIISRKWLPNDLHDYLIYTAKNTIGMPSSADTKLIANKIVSVMTKRMA
jgi:hypothetical protein